MQTPLLTDQSPDMESGGPQPQAQNPAGQGRNKAKRSPRHNQKRRNRPKGDQTVDARSTKVAQRIWTRWWFWFIAGVGMAGTYVLTRNGNLTQATSNPATPLVSIVPEASQACPASKFGPMLETREMFDALLPSREWLEASAEDTAATCYYRMQPIRVLVKPVGNWLNASANSSSLKTFGTKLLDFSEATMPPQALPIWEDSTGGMTPSEMSIRGIFWKIVLGMNVIALPLCTCLWHTFLGGAGKGTLGAAARDPLAAGVMVVVLFGIGSFNTLAALGFLAILAAVELTDMPHYSPVAAFSKMLGAARRGTPQQIVDRVKGLHEWILSTQVSQFMSGWSPQFRILALFICYHIFHKLFLYSLVDVSVAYGYISMASGFNWELWYWWTRWIFVFVNSTAATKYWCYYKDRPSEPLASSVIDVALLLCPGIGTDITLAKSWIFAGLTFHTAQCGTDPNMIYRLGVLGTISIVSICLPMIENLRTSSDVDLASFVASHWPIACATPSTSPMTSADTTPASQPSLRETARSAAILKAIPQVTEPRYKTVLWHDSVEGVCELIFLFAVGGSPFIAFALFTSFGKILFIPVIRRILAEYIEASGDADMLLAYEKCHGHNKFSGQRGGMHLAADSANRWRFSLRMFDALQTLGADPAHRANTGQTPLHVAAETGHSEAAGCLLSKVGPDALGEPDAADMTPLHFATAKRHGASMVDELLRATKDTPALRKALGHPNNEGRVPLGEAAHNGNADAYSSLLEARADHAIGNLHHQQSPLQVASACGHSAGLFKGCFTASDMKKAGFSASRFKGSFSLVELKNVFNPAELKEGGFSAADLQPAFRVSDLKDCFDLEALAPLFDAAELKQGGFKVKQLQAVLSLAELKSKGFQVVDLKPAFSLGQLKEADFGIPELKHGGFNLEELKAAFDASELKEEGFGLKDLKPFFTPLQLKDSGFTLEQLKDAFKALELKQANFTLAELKAAGARLTYLKDAFSISELQEAHFGVEELKSCGFKAEQLKDAFDISELKDGGFGVIDLKPFFTPLQLKEAGFESARFLDSSLTDLKAQGISVEELKEAFSIAELKEVLTLDEMKAGGLGILDLRAGGFNLQELKNAGFSSKDFWLADVLDDEQWRHADFTSEEIERGRTEAMATGWTYEAARARNRAR